MHAWINYQSDSLGHRLEFGFLSHNHCHFLVDIANEELNSNDKKRELLLTFTITIYGLALSDSCWTGRAHLIACPSCNHHLRLQPHLASTAQSLTVPPCCALLRSLYLSLLVLIYTSTRLTLSSPSRHLFTCCLCRPTLPLQHLAFVRFHVHIQWAD